MKIRSDTLLGVLRPALNRIPWDWAVYAGLLMALGAACIQSRALLSDRPGIVREVITLSAGVDIGALAAIFAASTIFASLMTKQFLKFIKDVDYLVSIFALNVALLTCSVLLGFGLYLSSYATDLVASVSFFWLCVAAEWLFFWSVLQIVDSFRIVSLQMLVVSREPALESRCKCCPVPPESPHEAR